MNHTTPAIPPAAWRASLLRGLDALARESIAAASVVRSHAAGATVWREHDAADAIAVVLEGSVELLGTRRGDDVPSRVRLAAPGDTIGEEALLGLPRRTVAVVREAVQLLVIPAALFLRGSGRSGASAVAAERRFLERQATADVIRQQALGRTLPPDDLDLLLDAVSWERHGRGAKIFAAGEPPQAAWLLCDGLVQLQTEHDEGIHVRAYLTRGDTFGDDEALSGEPRGCDAVALGAVSALRVPAAVLRTLVDRNPGLRSEFARVQASREQAQRQVVGEAAARTTQHVFRDLYRMQMARSLLVIDQDTCVRCGHCSWTCASLHGTSRLVRRGDKVVTRLPVLGQQPRSLLVPNSCQHCKNPSCMIDCPTGAIGRDPMGEVFIRAELCTGCGSCAKACPWDNIRMETRSDALLVAAKRRGAPLYADVATKCDLCRDYDGPGCVTMCPTGAILRLDPTRDVAEVAAVLGDPAATSSRGASWKALLAPVATAFVVMLAIAGAIAAAARVDGGAWIAARGPGYAAGVIAATATVVLSLHAVVKRAPRLWVHRRSRRRDVAGVVQGSPRSRIRWLVRAHVWLGLLAIAGVLGHAGTRIPDGPAGALLAAWWATAILGGIGAVAYATVPRRLTRIERDGALPEDLRGRRRELVDRLYRAGSGRSELVKAIAERVLVPYARSPFGPIALALTGRSVADEQRRLRARIDVMLQGRGAPQLGGMDELVRVVVELRALPVRRVLTALLRVFLPMHVVTTAVVLGLLVVHVLVVLGR